MSRHSAKAAPLGVALICGLALALGGCGGSDDSTSTPAATQTTSDQQRGAGGDAASAAGRQSQKGKDPGAGDAADGASNSNSSNDSNRSNSSSEARVTPLEVSGGGSSQFRVKGGDNSVQEFGDEGDEGELREAAELVHDFYAARATGDWGAACALLSESMLERLEQLAASAPDGQDTRCATFLANFTADLPASEWRLITTVDAGSLRHEGEQGFLIYYGPDRTVYAMPLLDEGGAWKINALSAAQLPGA